MALRLLEETWRGQTTGFRQEFREIPGGVFIQERNHVRRYDYESDNQLDGTQVILSQALAFVGPTPPLPVIGSVHPDDPQAFLVTYAVRKEEESAHHGQIDANYTTAPNPVDEPAKVDYGEGSTERIFEGAEAFVNKDGSEDLPGSSAFYDPADLPAGAPYPITNSAFKPFVPPPTDQEPYLVLTVKKNLSVAQWQPKNFLDNFARRINSVVYTVKGQAYAPGTVFLTKPPTASEQFDRNTAVKYYQTTWTFWIRARGWGLRLQDMGFYELNVAGEPSFGDRPIIGMLSRQPITEPAKLDGQGQKAKLGQPTYILEYRVRKKANFHDLPLGI